MNIRTFIGVDRVEKEPEVVAPKPVSATALVLNSHGMDLYLGRILGQDTVDLASSVEGFGLKPGSFETSKKKLADELRFTYGVLGDSDATRKLVDGLVAASIERPDLKEVIGAENKAAATLKTVTDLLQVDYPVEARQLRSALQDASGITAIEYRRALGSIIVPTLRDPVGKQSLSLYDVTNDLERRRVIEIERKKNSEDKTTWIDEDYLPSIKRARVRLSESVDAIHVADSKVRDDLCEALERTSKPLELVVDIYASLLDECKRRADVVPFIQDLTTTLDRIIQGKAIFVSDTREILESEGVDAALDFVSDTAYGISLGANPKQAVKYARTGIKIERDKGRNFRNGFDEAVEFGVKSGHSFDNSCQFAANYLGWVARRDLDPETTFDRVATSVDKYGVGLDDVVHFVDALGVYEKDFRPDKRGKEIDKALWVAAYKYTLDGERNGVRNIGDESFRSFLAERFMVRVNRDGATKKDAYTYLTGCMFGHKEGLATGNEILTFGDIYSSAVKAYGAGDTRRLFVPTYFGTVKAAQKAGFKNVDLASLVGHVEPAVKFLRENPDYLSRVGDLSANALFAYVNHLSTGPEESWEFARRSIDVGKSGGNFRRWAGTTKGYREVRFSLVNAMRLADALESYAKVHDGVYKLDDVDASLRIHTGSEDEKVAYALERLSSGNGVNNSVDTASSTSDSGSSDPGYSARAADVN